MPEHSLGSYHLASVLGADYVEPDLVLTKDAVIVCMHDPDLAATTDVADRPEFASKRRNLTAFMYGKNTTIENNWFTIDFTLAELKKLRLKQRQVGIRPSYFDQTFTVPTFQEYLDKIKEMSEKMGVKIGLVPELKHSNFHNLAFKQKKPYFFENLVLDTLEKNGFPRRNPNNRAPLSNGFTRVVLQTFEKEAARYLRKNSDHDIMALVDDDWTRFTTKGLAEVKTYATIFSPWKEVFKAEGPWGYLKTANVTVNPKSLQAMGGFVSGDKLASEVHRLGMRLVVYTFYDSREMKTSRREELESFFNLGADGLFIENVSEAVRLRSEYLAGKGALSTLSS